LLLRISRLIVISCALHCHCDRGCTLKASNNGYDPRYAQIDGTLDDAKFSRPLSATTPLDWCQSPPSVSSRVALDPALCQEVAYSMIRSAASSEQDSPYNNGNRTKRRRDHKSYRVTILAARITILLPIGSRGPRTEPGDKARGKSLRASQCSPDTPAILFRHT